MKRMLPLSMLAAVLTAVALPSVAMQSDPAPAREEAMAPGDPKMVNFEHVANFQTTGTTATGHATDIEFFTTEGKDYAVMGSYDGGGWIYDITDPEHPSFVTNIPCNQQQNDIQIKQFGTRWILVMTRDGNAAPCVTPALGAANGGGIAVFDVTDPAAPQGLYSFRNTGGAHNFTFHPSKPYGWVSTGDLPGGLNHIPILDFTNVDLPVQVADIPIQGGPHDIAFSQDGLRAFVASENNYRIFDTTDPAAPVEITDNPVPNSGTYAHGFDPTPDRKLAVATNESLALGGFFAPSTGVCPGEGLTFYNVEGANEANPVRLGSFLIADSGPVPPGDDRVCTGHVGKLGNTAMTLGWYIGGVRVVDFSNPSAPKEVGVAVMPGTEVWSAKFYKGPYVYASDQRRGFDVYRWTGQLPPPWDSGAPLPEVPGVGPCASPTIVGANGNSRIFGTNGNDVIVDPGGDNVITTGGGNDIVCTGKGDDEIKTKGGNDTVIDKGGNNLVVAGGGNDSVKTGKGRDVVKAGGGSDVVKTAGGRDTISGGGANDTLRGGAGRDACKGGGGKNSLKGC